VTDHPAHVFDDEYTGPRWTYGLRNRPPMLGAVPRGYIIDSHRPHPDWRHGTLQYPFPLSDRDVDAYELTPVTL
jgi:hypothetical protein